MVRKSPCAFCIEESCRGSRDCDCSACEKLTTCPRVLRPVIRVTTRCTQRCEHCCFACSPDRDDHMTVETARGVRQFLDANNIWCITVMGGEVFCHPEWATIVPILLGGRDYVRIVTNGDWADGTGAFLDVLEPFRDCVKLSISRDRWHTNARVEAALAECRARGFHHSVTTDDEDNLDNIVPVGRGEFHHSFYNMMGCHCQNPDCKYSFLIDEGGTVYKCGFGVWDYTSIDDHLEGGFAARFKEFNQVFYGTFIGSCARCVRAWGTPRRPAT